jgi:Protein of unknown function (DUF3309)
MLQIVLVILLVLLVVGLLPQWPYAQGWAVGYWPSGGLTVILVVLLIVFLMRGL